MTSNHKITDTACIYYLLVSTPNHMIEGSDWMNRMQQLKPNFTTIKAQFQFLEGTAIHETSFKLEKTVDEH